MEFFPNPTGGRAGGGRERGSNDGYRFSTFVKEGRKDGRKRRKGIFSLGPETDVENSTRLLGEAAAASQRGLKGVYFT